MKAIYNSPASTSVRLRTEGMMASSLTIGGSEDETTGETNKVSTETQVLSNDRKNSSSGVWKWMDD